MIQEIWIIISALFGFFIACYVQYKKRRGEKLVCVIGQDCTDMVTGKFSRVWGIPLEQLGMWYYGTIALFYGVGVYFPILHSGVADAATAFLSMLAFLFSLYLTAIQIVVLQNFCEWCLASSVASVVIFFAIIF